MKIIVGLGNPWEKYLKTRHNLGFIFLDKFSSEYNFSQWKYESKFTADISSWVVKGEKIILVKPQTFMNLSWESIQKICHFYKLSAEDICVIYDDISMDFWKIRVRKTGSAGGHNGVKSIITYLWDSWCRIKVWVWNDSRYDVSDWVLSKFTEEELIDLDTTIYKETEEKILENLS